MGTGDFGRLAASQELSSTLVTLEKSICWQRPAKSTWQEQSKRVLLGLAVPLEVLLAAPLAGLVVLVVLFVVVLKVLTLRFC